MPKRVTITLSDDLFEAAELLRKKHKLYRTISEFVQGFIRYDGLTQKEHHITAGWASLTGYERDRLDAGILARIKSGEAVHGSWLENRIEAIVKRHTESGRTPTAKEVAAELAAEIVMAD
jgi:hypothetical protein